MHSKNDVFPLFCFVQIRQYSGDPIKGHLIAEYIRNPDLNVSNFTFDFFESKVDEIIALSIILLPNKNVTL